MNATESNTRHWAARLNGAFWLALILFAAAGLLVVRDLPAWMIALVVGAGVALGTLAFLPRWLVKRRDPAYSMQRSYYLAFWVQGGPTAVPLVTLSNGQKTVVFQGMQHVGSEDLASIIIPASGVRSQGFQP
ncbi:hypothetical protein [uncultured Thiodictyon sp.]|uniref:hypothetical protein n=1 Tax=uncultured Thiodictyon sp. TaxID=1846217 RepID=UPI002600B14E|nr:hypothetical protein [uncultured Thiodictyon sp.]